MTRDRSPRLSACSLVADLQILEVRDTKLAPFGMAQFASTPQLWTVTQFTADGLHKALQIEHSFSVPCTNAHYKVLKA